MKGNIVKEQPQQSIGTAASRIPKGLQRHKFPKGRVENINDVCEPLQSESITNYNYELRDSGNLNIF